MEEYGSISFLRPNRFGIVTLNLRSITAGPPEARKSVGNALILSVNLNRPPEVELHLSFKHYVRQYFTNLFFRFLSPPHFFRSLSFSPFVSFSLISFLLSYIANYKVRGESKYVSTIPIRFIRFYRALSSYIIVRLYRSINNPSTRFPRCISPAFSQRHSI